MVSASDLQSGSPGFESRSDHFVELFKLVKYLVYQAYESTLDEI